jgi:thymidylate synthase ThyX
MTITAKVIAHSRHVGSPDLITLECRYPRFIHAEFMTHRAFSRNASSSRAVPVARMIQDVLDDPAMPVAWGSNKPGMQAGEELAGDKIRDAVDAWLSARDTAVRHATRMANTGAHKQIVNRVLEPFAHISVVVTATEWDNFFALRCHPDADPTMRALADAMRDAIAGSVPRQTMDHLPYIGDDDLDHIEVAALISAARCARVSYLNHDGTAPDIDKDLALAKRLLDSRHMSPFEHQAIANPGHRSRNFNGWTQHRALVECAP